MVEELEVVERPPREVREAENSFMRSSSGKAEGGASPSTLLALDRLDDSSVAELKEGKGCLVQEFSIEVVIANVKYKLSL